MVDDIRALERSPSLYNPGAGKPGSKKKKSLLKKGGATLAGIAIIGFVLIAALINAGTLVPTMVETSLIDETDIQCANGTIDKEWAFIESLNQGAAPSDTIENLKESNILIGRLDENNNFVEDSQGTLLKKGDKVLAGQDLFNAFQTDVDLYKAFDAATYSCAAFYYDDAAERTFAELGTGRNNYHESTNFDAAITYYMDSDANININSAEYVEKTVVDSDGKTYKTASYENTGDSVNPYNSTAEDLVEATRIKNPAATSEESALNTADVLKVADTAAKEQRSSRFFLYFMEGIDKMKAGDGDTAPVNDIMNFLTTSSTVDVVDTTTGEVKQITGTPLDSPALNAVLSGTAVSADASKNYSSDRVLQTIENQLNLNVAETNPEGNLAFDAIGSTVSSFSQNVSGIISRFIKNGIQTVEFGVLSPIIPTISSSLIKNSAVDSIYGVSGGEMLVEGAVNVGRKLASKGSGATAGDSATVLGYQKQVQQIAALNKAVEASSLSPFDLTSKSTFLGSFAYQLLPVLTKSTSLTSLATNTLAAIIPSAHADGEETKILTSFGNCETYASVGAVGSAHCSLIGTFDTSTQNDPYHNQEYLDFVEANTYLDSNGNRQIKDNSALADFILYNNERISPFGTLDAGIISSKKNTLSFLTPLTDTATAVLLLNTATPEEKAIASGAAFVNSANNPYWDTYKYAQRYVSINRAVSMLKKFSTDPTAYQSLKGCEGTLDPVIAFTEKHANYIASQNTPFTLSAPETTTQKATNYAPAKADQNLAVKPLNTRNNHLVVAEVINQTLAPRFVELREYIIKQNDWTLC